MKKLQWYFDFISPFAYLQWQTMDKLPDDIEIEYCPVLFAGLLSHWEHKGPAEIPAKRTFTYKYVLWLAKRLEIPLIAPPTHPFNPLKALRLTLALGCDPKAIDSIFKLIWQRGLDIEAEENWCQLLEDLKVANAGCVAQQEVKDKLRTNVDMAINKGVFGVPTFVIANHVFWGFDATEMVIDYLQNPNLFTSEEMQRLEQLPWSQNIRRIPQ